MASLKVVLANGQKKDDEPEMTDGGREAWIGGLVLAFGVSLVGYFYGSEGLKDKREAGYRVVAHFSRSDGLARGGEVRLAGVPVGQVVGQTLGENYQVRVTLHMAEGIGMPGDSVAVIHSDSLLGPKFIEILPGGSERMIPPDGSIRYTQDAVLIDDLLEHILARARKGAVLPAKEPSSGGVPSVVP